MPPAPGLLLLCLSLVACGALLGVEELQDNSPSGRAGSSGGSAAGAAGTGTAGSGGNSGAGAAGGPGGAGQNEPVCALARDSEQASLSCPPGQVIVAINFASYGAPSGGCGAFGVDKSCHKDFRTIVEDICLGMPSCHVVPNDEPLGNPCTDSTKVLAIQAQCGAVTCGDGAINPACDACGDGKKNGTEECDGADLGVSCQGGSASCGAGCKLDLSSCVLESPPSCAGQPALCGPDQDRDCSAACGPEHDQDCCNSPLIPGGNFLRNYEAGASPGALFSSKAYPAKVSDFRLDRYEVTVGRFRRFINAVIEGWRPPSGSGLHAHLPGGRITNPDIEQGWNTPWNTHLFSSQSQWDAALQCGIQSRWTPAPGRNENFALPCINWYQAYAFCIWDGGFLPTQAEAFHAGSGGSEQRVFPWSSPPGSKIIDPSYLDSGCLTKCPEKSVRVPGFFSPKGDGKWGHSDLSGGLIEWLLDWPANDPVQAYILSGPCDDCALTVDSNPGVLNPKKKLRQRGDYRAPWEPYAHNGTVSFESPSLHGDNTSVRCARVPVP